MSKSDWCWFVLLTLCTNLPTTVISIITFIIKSYLSFFFQLGCDRWSLLINPQQERNSNATFSLLLTLDWTQTLQDVFGNALWWWIVVPFRDCHLQSHWFMGPPSCSNQINIPYRASINSRLLESQLEGWQLGGYACLRRFLAVM